MQEQKNSCQDCFGLFYREGPFVNHTKKLSLLTSPFDRSQRKDSQSWFYFDETVCEVRMVKASS
ncbi:hypothetical protein CW304_02545 [Bacillus sp. UFRGS-B20]|nr:hypothetical protein CW304_02545 [Bacillus sp. UFRGS-B20]